MLADFFLVHVGEASVPSDPYDAIVAENLGNVDLVVIDGVPIYGDPDALHKLGVKTESLTICGKERALNASALPASPFAQVQARLDSKMKAIGSTLAPLAECVP
jgi:hypothetical protein